MPRQESLSYKKLIVSIVFSVFVWNFIFGSMVFAIILIVSIFIHEYGHYWWMGKEGIKKRDMLMFPPFGVLAISKELRKTYKIETRIALAGPLCGLLSLLGFLILLLITQEPIWAASALLVAFINFFNLLPIGSLDGGRIIKSLAVSIHPVLESVFNVFAFVFIIFILIYFSTFFGFFLCFLWFIELSRSGKAKTQLPGITTLLQELNTIKARTSSFEEIFPILEKQRVTCENIKQNAELLINRPTMNKDEMLPYFVLYLALLYTYAKTMNVFSEILNTSPFFTLDLLKYF